jgi:hypothetical protein
MVALAQLERKIVLEMPKRDCFKGRQGPARTYREGNSLLERKQGLGTKEAFPKCKTSICRYINSNLKVTGKFVLGGHQVIMTGQDNI